jgi:hypothetical protein
MMAVTGEKEPPIAGRAAIWVLKQHVVKQPIFEAASSRTEEVLATAMGTTRDLSLRSGFVHGRILCWGRLCYIVKRPEWKRKLSLESNAHLKELSGHPTHQEFEARGHASTASSPGR